MSFSLIKNHAQWRRIFINRLVSVSVGSLSAFWRKFLSASFQENGNRGQVDEMADCETGSLRATADTLPSSAAVSP